MFDRFLSVPAEGLRIFANGEHKKENTPARGQRPLRSAVTKGKTQEHGPFVLLPQKENKGEHTGQRTKLPSLRRCGVALRPRGENLMLFAKSWATSRGLTLVAGYSQNHVQDPARTLIQFMLKGRFSEGDYLHVSAGQDTGANLLVNRSQPIGRQLHPTRQGLAR